MYGTANGCQGFHYAGNLQSDDPATDWGLVFFDLASNQETVKLAGARWTEIRGESAFCYSPTGDKIAVGHARGAVKVWKVDSKGAKCVFPPMSGVRQDPQTLWSRLGDRELSRFQVESGTHQRSNGIRAAREMIAASDLTVKLLTSKLEPIPERKIGPLRQSIAELNSPDFPVREKAYKQLQQSAWEFSPFLRQAYLDEKSPEIRKRLSELLTQVAKSPIPVEQLRDSRGVYVLQQINSPVARAYLQHLAGGAQGARLTELASLALERAGP